MPIFRAAQQFIDGARAADASTATSLARQASEALDAIAAVRKLPSFANFLGEGTLVAEGGVTTITDADFGHGTDEELSVQRIDELSAKAKKDGIGGLSTKQVLVLVLLWLLTIGAPVVQVALPPEAQTVVSNEYATLGLGIAITLVIVQNRNR